MSLKLGDGTRQEVNQVLEQLLSNDLHTCDAAQRIDRIYNAYLPRAKYRFGLLLTVLTVFTGIVTVGSVRSARLTAEAKGCENLHTMVCQCRGCQ